MDRRILKRIAELKERLYALRAHRPDSTTLIAIQALEQELTQTAARLPREWDMILNGEPQDSVKSRSLADGKTEVLKVPVVDRVVVDPPNSASSIDETYSVRTGVWLG